MNKQIDLGVHTAAAPCPTSRHRHAVAVLVALVTVASAAQAAGGHHAVDDAALLEPGQCQVDAWWDHENGGDRRLLHIGPACRVGAVEIGLNLDHVRLDGTGTNSAASAQVKWAHAVRDGVSVGAVLLLAAQEGAPRFAGGTLVVPVTWQATDALLAHVNLGRDFKRRQVDTGRAGLALEWAPTSHWSFVGERFRESGGNFWRAGTRWAATPTTTVDLSGARGLGGHAPTWWTLGATWVFDR